MMSRQPCRHSRLLFLGYQETLSEDEFLMLYRCLNCDTTVSFKKELPAGKKTGIPDSNLTH